MFLSFPHIFSNLYNSHIKFVKTDKLVIRSEKRQPDGISVSLSVPKLCSSILRTWSPFEDLSSYFSVNFQRKGQTYIGNYSSEDQL